MIDICFRILIRFAFICLWSLILKNTCFNKVNKKTNFCFVYKICLKFKINGDRADLITELIGEMQSRIIVNSRIELFTTRYANLWTKIFQKKKKPLASEVSVPLGFSWINSAAPLIVSRVVFLSVRKRSFLRGPRALSPDIFLRNNTCSSYISRVSIPAALRDRTIVINPRIFPVEQNPRNPSVSNILCIPPSDCANCKLLSERSDRLGSNLRCKIYPEKQQLDLYFYFSKCRKKLLILVVSS